MLSRCKILIGSFLRQKPLSTVELAAIWFQFVDIAYRLQVCPEIESLKCYSLLENPFLGMSRILLLVLRDNTKNGWVWHTDTPTHRQKIMKQYLYVLKFSFSYIYFSFRIPYAFDRAWWPLSDQSPSRVWRLSVRSLWTIPVCSLHRC